MQEPALPYSPGQNDCIPVGTWPVIMATVEPQPGTSQVIKTCWMGPATTPNAGKSTPHIPPSSSPGSVSRESPSERATAEKAGCAESSGQVLEALAFTCLHLHKYFTRPLPEDSEEKEKDIDLGLCPLPSGRWSHLTTPTSPIHTFYCPQFCPQSRAPKGFILICAKSCRLTTRSWECKRQRGPPGTQPQASCKPTRASSPFWPPFQN